MSHIALTSSDQSFERRVRRALGAGNGGLSVHSGELAEAHLQRLIVDLVGGSPDVVAIGPDIPLESALELARALDRSRPEIAVLLVTGEQEGLWEQALKAGVRDVVAVDTTDTQLRQALEEAAQVTKLRRQNIARAGERSGSAGRVITVVAPKGGSGKTALATNLGVGLARTDPGRVALVDLDLMFGDITSVLRLQPEHTLYDLEKSTGFVDATTVKVFLTQLGDLHILAAPARPDQGEQVTESSIRATIEILAGEMAYVVIDTPAGLTEMTIPAIEMSTDLIFVCDLSVAAVDALSKLIEAIDHLQITGPRRHFVINRADSAVGLDLTEVATAIGHTIDLKLPSTRAVPLSMNSGTPLIESTPKSPYSRQIEHLVEQFTGVELKSRGLFGWRKR